MRRSTSLLLLACLAVAASPARGDDDPAAVLVRTDLAFARATAERGLDGWLAYFAEDAAIFPASGPIVRGLAAIRAHYAGTGFTGRGLTWQPAHAELSSAGDLGYTYGTWRHTTTSPDGSPVVRTGKYTTIWRRQPDGTWKLVVDIGSSDAASD